LRIGRGLALAQLSRSWRPAPPAKAAALPSALPRRYRLNISRMFAALVLISFAGLLIYGALALISQLALRRWHDSARARPM